MGLPARELLAALCLRDLTDPAHGRHAMQELVAAVVGAVAYRWGCPVVVWRQPPVTTAQENYDALLYPLGGGARDARHTRWLDHERLLRTQTSALVPAALRQLAEAQPEDVLLACPGLTWRRDRVDKVHVGEPHQLDLWLLSKRRLELLELIEVVARAALPGRTVTPAPAVHPYTTGGLQLDVDGVEIGECGLASRELLARCGLPDHHGLAMGLGLDRLLMLRKGIEDIRVLRTEPMVDLEPYVARPKQPAMCRDLSLALHPEVTLEELGDLARSALGEEAECLEDVSVVARTPYDELPVVARQRLGIRPGQVNVLIRITLRHPLRVMTRAEADRVRQRVWCAWGQGK